EIDEETLSRAYRRQAAALAEGGVDGILCRSFTELDALRIALEAAKAATNLPLIGSMVFDSGPDFTETVMHVTVPQAAAAIREAGASMVGCDHAEHPDAAADVVGMLRAACDLPVWVEINAGRAELSEDRRVYPETPKAYGERLPALAQAGATIIGGGRGATRDHIAAMRQARDRFLRRRKGRPSAPQ
ncbi:MAG: homocysteine S-methyltransferase family protein, partial [Phycisphaerae bacterium]